MKKIIFLSFVTACVVFTAYAEEVPAKKSEPVKSSTALLSPKKPKPAECVAPAKPAAPAEPAKPVEAAAPATSVKPAQAAKAAAAAIPAEPAKPAPGTCLQEAEKSAANSIKRIDHEE